MAVIDRSAPGTKLLKRCHYNDGSHPFATTDWSGASGITRSISGGKLRGVSATGWAPVALTAIAARSKQYVYARYRHSSTTWNDIWSALCSHVADEGGSSYDTLFAYVQTGASAAIQLQEFVDGVHVTPAATGTGTARSEGVDYRYGLFQDGATSVFRDISSAVTVNKTLVTLTTGRVGWTIGSESQIDFAHYVHCTDRIVTVEDVPTGGSAEIRGINGAVLAAAAESGGVASINVQTADVPLELAVKLVVKDSEDVIVATRYVAGELIEPGETYVVSGDFPAGTLTRTSEGYLFGDNFNRANGAPGSGWHVSGNAAISGNKLVSTTDDGWARDTEDTLKEMVAQGKVSVPAGQAGGPVVRFSSNGKGWYFQMQEALYVYMFHMNPGYTASWLFANWAYTPDVLDDFKIHVKNSYQKGWFGEDGLAVGTLTQTEVNSIQGSGGVLSNTSASLDDYHRYRSNLIRVINLPADYKARVGTREATAVSGVATVDLDKDLCPSLLVEVLNASGELDAVLEPEATGTSPVAGAWGGDEYRYGTLGGGAGRQTPGTKLPKRNDQNNPFVLSEWDVPAELAKALVSGKLEFTLSPASVAWRWARLNTLAALSKAFVYAEWESPNDGLYIGVLAHITDITAGSHDGANFYANIQSVLANTVSGIAQYEAGVTTVIQSTSPLSFVKSVNTPYTGSVAVDGTAIRGRDHHDANEYIGVVTIPGSGQVGFGVYGTNGQLARLRVFIVGTDWITTVVGVPAGGTVEVQDIIGTLLAPATTEVNGTATVDMTLVQPLDQAEKLVVKNADGTIYATYYIAGEIIEPGETYIITPTPTLPAGGGLDSIDMLSVIGWL